MRSIKNENKEIEILIFKCTVLESYWELEARTGTKIKLRFCTFTSLRLFAVLKTTVFTLLQMVFQFLGKN